MRYGDFLGSLSLASSHSGGFPYSVEHMAGEGQPAQAVVSWLVNVAVSELMNITRAGRYSPIRREVSNAYVCVLRARAR